METRDECERAIDALNETKLGHRFIMVQFAGQPASGKPPQSGRGRGSSSSGRGKGSSFSGRGRATPPPQGGRGRGSYDVNSGGYGMSYANADYQSGSNSGGYGGYQATH